ncbi:NAD-dependent epimerase/dehydratase family protein [Devosia sp.]|uniref:NAD-dependent epimerase/dehydratase family protein n=1 Tax=Devosia sp. TaxID=1871048 RepID=UPI001AC48D89|nr:NAD-dependent epimerase/dehydratase family protein [Devosia sp.]MBN9332120.1 NAD-dependent epimerase/dehydratase family protein [Devosia sp.]
MIRWITPFLGTAPAGSPDISPDIQVVDVRDLVDKNGNNLDAIRLKIEQGTALLEAGQRLVVCCDYGISRSNSIAAGILFRHGAMSFDAAVREVRRTTGENEIKLEPLNAVRAALRADEPVPKLDGLRVLITGGSGFIGSALSGALEGAAFVLAPSRAQADLSAGAVALDLLVKEHRINTLVHLANPRIYTSAQATGDAVTMLRNALDVCRENGLRLIFLSGWEVYSGYRSVDLLADETLPTLPKGPYGEAKMLCETLIGHYRQLHGLDAVIVRSSPVYGIGSDRPKFIYNFLDKARRGAPIQTHCYLNGSPQLDLLHIDDLQSALLSILTSDASGDFNVGTSQMTSTLVIASAIVERTQSASKVVQHPIADYAPNIRMDYTRVRKILGWEPSWSISDGLDQIIMQGKT